MQWDAVTAIASVISMAAFVATALFVRAELKALEKDRYLNITSQLFAIWESEEFMRAQLWLLHRLEERSWESFVAAHRADTGEMAFHRVGSFYDRVGTLVRRGLVDEDEILSTMGAYAIAVWQRIEPLVREARQVENSVLFDDFERLLPACYECYVPSLKPGARVNPFSLSQEGDRIQLSDLRERMERGDAVTVLDVRSPTQASQEPATLPGAVRIPPDEIEQRYPELPPDREVAVYCA